MTNKPIYSREAEEAAIGCVLISQEAYYEADTIIKATDFYLHQHVWIWEVFTELLAENLPIDHLTVQNRLERKGYLDEIGGAGYLVRLVNSVPTSLNVAAYATLIKRDSLRRKLLETATSIARLAYEEEREVNLLIGDAQRMTLTLGLEEPPSDALVGEAAQRYVDSLLQVVKEGAVATRVLTGMIDVDQVLHGFDKGDLVLVAGRPGVGKTAFLLSTALNAARLHGKRATIFSLEMNQDQLVSRLLAMESGVDSQKINKAQLSDADLPRLAHGVQSLLRTQIILDDSPALTPETLRSKCIQFEARYGPLDLVVVDYIQLMQSGLKRIENRTQEIGHISRSLKLLARALRVPILAGAQLNRAIETRQEKRPVLSDLREGGSQEQDADTVMFLYRPDMNANLTELIIAKNRNGPTGDATLNWNGPTTQFRNAAIVTDCDLIYGGEPF